MGVSATWLELVGKHVEEQEVPESLKQRIFAYRSAHAAVVRDWKRFGQHAFLHHLNAIFAYEPIIVRNQQAF